MMEGLPTGWGREAVVEKQKGVDRKEVDRVVVVGTEVGTGTGTGTGKNREGMKEGKGHDGKEAMEHLDHGEGMMNGSGGLVDDGESGAGGGPW